ncbi:serine/arginine repetitive matrix protein 1 [Triticum aestivum]|uniref:serine/arginine repetitive matrix protein 1 n=1 Tax=Triticum aestivum TaxID=4565 RepID=UPI001D0339BB|nr:serine/arginine repetitive matrix protein 1-like [Triticum aestivum]
MGRSIWPPAGFPRPPSSHRVRVPAPETLAVAPSSFPAATPPRLLCAPPPSAAAPSEPAPMPHEWDDEETRPKRRADDRRDAARPSPDAVRREDDLCRQLSTRDGRRSPPRSDRRSPPCRSPGRADRRGRSRSRSPAPTAEWRSQRRRSPSPQRRRDSSHSPVRGGRSRSPPRPQQQQQPAPNATSRRYQPPRGEPAFPPNTNGAGRGRQGAKKKKKRGLGRGNGAAPSARGGARTGRSHSSAPPPPADGSARPTRASRFSRRRAPTPPESLPASSRPSPPWATRPQHPSSLPRRLRPLRWWGWPRTDLLRPLSTSRSCRTWRSPIPSQAPTWPRFRSPPP